MLKSGRLSTIIFAFKNDSFLTSSKKAFKKSTVIHFNGNIFLSKSLWIDQNSNIYWKISIWLCNELIFAPSKNKIEVSNGNKERSGWSKVQEACKGKEGWKRLNKYLEEK